MAATYDLTTDVGKVRLLTGLETDVTLAIFEDAEIQALIDLEGDIKLAAAQAVDLIANSEAFILKVISILDLRTDGPAVARALREHSKDLRDQYNRGETGDAYEGDFDIAEEPDTLFGYRQLYAKSYLRTHP